MFDLFISMPKEALILNIVSGIMLTFSCVMLGYWFHKHSIIQNAASAAKERFEKEHTENTIADRTGDKGDSTIKQWMKKPRQLFLYSGIARTIPWLTFEIFLIIGLFGGCIAYLAAWLILRDIFYALCVMGIWMMLLVGSQLWMANSNYRTVDNHLIPFLNQLGNFSAVGSVEITEVFAHVAKYMPYPLRDVLEECYAEAHTSGDSAEALSACSDKIEHPKFKEIIRNLEACMRYTANYKVVVDGMRSNILDDRRNSQERKSMASSSVTYMLIVTVMSLFVMLISESALGMPIREVLLDSGVGRASLVLAGISYVIFAWNVFLADH